MLAKEGDSGELRQGVAPSAKEVIARSVYTHLTCRMLGSSKFDVSGRNVGRVHDLIACYCVFEPGALNRRLEAVLT